MTSKIDLPVIDIDVFDAMRHGRNPAVGLANRSLENYVLTAQQFNIFLRSRNLNVNEDSVKSFFESHHHWSPSTINNKRAGLMKLIQYQPEIKESHVLRAAVRIMFESVPHAKKINQSVREGKYLTESQVKRLIKTASKRIGLMIEFAYVTGCRVTELITARRWNVLESSAVCTIKIVGKGSKQGDVFCDRALIQEIFEVFDGAVYLFETMDHESFDRSYVWREMKKVGERCGIKVYPHIFRHSCAMHLKKKGKPVDYIQKYLRHADVATTLRFYFHHEPDQKITRLFDIR